MIKIAIVEDREETLNYLKALLGGSRGFAVIGAYSTGQDAIRGIEQQPPDAAVVDIGLPDISGIEVIQSIRAQSHSIEILAYTMYEDREHLIAAVKAGATGYILKGASSVEIIEAVQNIVAGGAPMSPKIARYIIEDYQCGAHQRRKDTLLTLREKEVLQYLAKGLTESKLAASLNLSPHTIHTHIKSIYRKLHANSQADAVMKAKRKGLV